MRYPCPKCGSGLELHKTFDRRISVSCAPCDAEAVLPEFKRNPDEAYIDFLAMYDTWEAQEGEGRGWEGAAKGGADAPRGLPSSRRMTRSRDEIEGMIGGNTPGRVARRALYSRLDYISHYSVIRDPEPEAGCDVGDLVPEAALADRIRSGGIPRFYRFQEEAIRRITRGENVMIEAPTASGKTEAFTVPAVRRAASEGSPGEIFAVLVYPTKALAQDQFPKISRLAAALGVRVGVFDGDTGQADRRRIVDDPPQVVITNFDALHHHMWRRTGFAALLGTVRLVVVDEVHSYSGIFGSNVHHVIRRLKRLRGRAGGRIQFVAASATLADAGRFCGELFGEEVRLVRGGGRRGETDFVMIFPSHRTQRALMVDLAEALTSDGHKTMVFSNSHRNAEMFAIQARRRGVDVMVHRAGMTAAYRNAVERRFRGGGLKAVSCTPTLELGIDVGGVDGVVSAMIPVNRLLQRIGRAARGGQRGYAFLALGNDPISQYYRNHPQDYLDDAEVPHIDPGNPFVEGYQVLAMACDAPLSGDEAEAHPGAVAAHLESGRIRRAGPACVPDAARAARALSRYSIRGIGGSIGIFLGSRKVGERALPVALSELHKDAIYLMGGAKYRVRELQYPGRGRAVLERAAADHPYYTRALYREWPRVEREYARRDALGVEIGLCRLRIRKQVYGYANMESGQDAAQGQKILLDAPLEYDFVTKGIAFRAPRPADAISAAEDGDYAEVSGYHAAEHVIIEGSNMVTGGASQDMGGISMGASGMIYVYDGAVGGNGASRALYDRFERAAARGLSVLSECPCTGEAGCPRCTFSYRCGNNNEFLHKGAAAEAFRRIAGGEKTSIGEPSGEDRPLA